MYRFVFLDIDGPMIPTGMFLLERDASIKRKFSPIAVACLNHLCHEAKAKIVFNSTHNRDRLDLANDAIREGVKKGHLYNEGSFTEYPQLHNRLDAIQLWLKEHGMNEDNSKWVAFDDADFKHPNLVLIDYDEGLHPGHTDKAMRILGKGTPILIL